MGQQANLCSKSNMLMGDVVKSRWKRPSKVAWITPEIQWSNHGQVEGITNLEDRTHECCKIRGWAVIRGERLIKLENSWFSAKSIEVECCRQDRCGRVTL